MKNIKMKMDVFECHYLLTDHVHLPSRSVECKNSSYLTLSSLVLAVSVLFVISFLYQCIVNSKHPVPFLHREYHTL